MSGSNNQNEVERLMAKANSAGIPAQVKPAEDLVIPMSTEEIRSSTAKLLEHLDDPEDQPLHHHDLEVEDRQEVATTPSRLDRDQQWFFMGLMYSLIKGVDRSMFEVYRAAGAPAFNTLTHQAAEPVVEVSGANLKSNPWAGVVQGIPHDHTSTFTAFVGSYRFKTGSPEVHQPGDQVWRVDWQNVRARDPFDPNSPAIDLCVALPVNLTAGRGMRLIKGPGLALSTPVFGVVALPDDEEIQSYG